MKKIGINIFPLEREKWSGIEIYTYELIKFLSKSYIDLEAYSLTKINLNDVELNNLKFKSFEKVKANSIQKAYYNIIGVNKLVSNLDVYHSTSFILPFNIKASKKIVTIHDLAFLRYPEYFDFKTRMYYKLFLEHSIKNADRIICISKSCLEDFSFYFPHLKYNSKLRLVYNGFNDFSKSNYNPFNPYGKYFLFIGASHKRKNLKRVLQSFKIFYKKNCEFKIIITGKDPDRIISEFCKENQMFNNIIHFEYVKTNELINLYKHSKLLLFPSIYEGFGFPILESMSCNVPVLTSKTSSCAEVSSYDNSFLADPFDVDDIVHKMEKILINKNYGNLVEIGKKRIKDFSWEKMGQEILDIYND